MALPRLIIYTLCAKMPVPCSEQFRTVTVFVLLSRLVLAALPAVVWLSLATLLLFVREFYDLYWIKVSAARPLDP